MNVLHTDAGSGAAPGCAPGHSIRLATVSLFHALHPEQIELLERCMQHRVYGPNEPVIKRNEVDQELHVVLSGTASVIDEGPRSRDWLTRTVGAGGVFGEICFLTGEPSTLSAVTGLDASEHLVLNRFDFDRLCRTAPQIGYTFYADLVRQLASRLEDLPRDFRDYVLWGYRRGPAVAAPTPPPEAAAGGTPQRPRRSSRA